MTIRHMIVLLEWHFASTTCQGQKLDSLRNLLSTKTDLQRLNALYQLAYECIDIDNPQAFPASFCDHPKFAKLIVELK